MPLYCHAPDAPAKGHWRLWSQYSITAYIVCLGVGLRGKGWKRVSCACFGASRNKPNVAHCVWVLLTNLTMARFMGIIGPLGDCFGAFHFTLYIILWCIWEPLLDVHVMGPPQQCSCVLVCSCEVAYVISLWVPLCLSHLILGWIAPLGGPNKMVLELAL